MNFGCVGAPSSGIPVKGRGKGFTDSNGKHEYVFTFLEGISIKGFSITMLDFGDYNPSRATNHEVRLTAYDADNNIVDSDSLSYNSSSEQNPHSSDFGELFLTGDACTADTSSLNKEPGVWTFKVSGEKITVVKLVPISGLDPNIAFDNIKFLQCNP